MRFPATWTVDATMAKNFALSGSVRLQLRADARTGQIGVRLTF